MTMERTVSRMIMTTVIQMVIPMERIPYGILPQRVLLRVNGKSGAGSQKGTSASGSVYYKTSPKTGAALPALPFVAVFAAAGIVVCGRKARKN